MAQGDLWKMGVGLPLYNWSFRVPCKVYTTLGTAYTSGLVLDCTRLSPTSPYGWQYAAGIGGSFAQLLNYYLKPGNIVTVGPSTVTGYEGKYEEAIVLSVDGNDKISVMAELVNDYAAGDAVTGIGTGSAAGWKVSVVSASHVADVTTSGHNIEGFDDKFYGMRFTTTNGQNCVIESVMAPGGTFSDFPTKARYLPRVEQETVYFLSAHIKMDNAPPAVSVLMSFVSFPTYYITLTAGAAWAESNGTVTIGVTDFTPGIIQFITYASVTNCVLDCVVACHAKGTDDAASGIYTFDEFPNLGSVRYDQRNAALHVDLINELQLTHFPGGANPKWVIRADFDSVSQTFWDNLMVLLTWQRKGFPMILKPNITDLPPYLYGTMVLRQARKRIWDLGKRSFQLEFTEA